jgi:hypothetical protein
LVFWTAWGFIPHKIRQICHANPHGRRSNWAAKTLPARRPNRHKTQNLKGNSPIFIFAPNRDFLKDFWKASRQTNYLAQVQARLKEISLLKAKLFSVSSDTTTNSSLHWP